MFKFRKFVVIDVARIINAEITILLQNKKITIGKTDMMVNRIYSYSYLLITNVNEFCPHKFQLISYAHR